MIRFAFYVFLFYVIYRLGKAWMRSLQRRDISPEDGSSTEEAELIQDPQCGTYFLKQRGILARSGDETLYFCSKDCRDKYLSKR
jgi:hypothetical protein